MQEDQKNGMKLASTVFGNNDEIPNQYTCKGDNINPPLNIIDVPAQAKSLVLIMHDPDAPRGDYLHWLVWDMQSSTKAINANDVPIGAVQGPNDSHNNQYLGPCPPKGSGTHHYIFELYALDYSLNLPPQTTREKIQECLAGHILDHCQLTGVVAA